MAVIREYLKVACSPNKLKTILQKMSLHDCDQISTSCVVSKYLQFIFWFKCWFSYHKSITLFSNAHVLINGGVNINCVLPQRERNTCTWNKGLRVCGCHLYKGCQNDVIMIFSMILWVKLWRRVTEFLSLRSGTEFYLYARGPSFVSMFGDRVLFLCSRTEVFLFAQGPSFFVSASLYDFELCQGPSFFRIC